MKFLYKIFVFLSLVLIAANCGDQVDISELTAGNTNNSGNISGDTVYIQQSPIWTGFNKPEAILVGREPFVYVADTKNDRIVMLDISGKVLGSKEVTNPTSIAQDYRLDLLVTGEITYNGQVYSAIFRIYMHDAKHDIASAKIDTLLPKSSFDYQRPDWTYTGVTTFADNKFYISRTGPQNTLIAPDNAILFSSTKTFTDGSTIDTINNQDKIAGFQPTGTGLSSSNGISSLSSMNDGTFDIVMTLSAADAVFKVQWLQYIQSQEFTGYVNRVDISSDLMQFNKFGNPTGSTVDRNGNLYVADAQKDSIYKFNAFGQELESFGGPDVFDSPHDVAFFDKTLYVLDTENDRIVRFILSTEL